VKLADTPLVTFGRVECKATLRARSEEFNPALRVREGLAGDYFLAQCLCRISLRRGCLYSRLIMNTVLSSMTSASPVCRKRSSRFWVKTWPGESWFVILPLCGFRPSESVLTVLVDRAHLDRKDIQLIRIDEHKGQ
jgi:hypothetical protein